MPIPTYHKIGSLAKTGGLMDDLAHIQPEFGANISGKHRYIELIVSIRAVFFPIVPGAPEIVIMGKCP